MGIVGGIPAVAGVAMGYEMAVVPGVGSGGAKAGAAMTISAPT